MLHPVCRFGAWAPKRIPFGDTGSMARRRSSVSSTIRRLLRELGTFVRLGLTSRARLAADNLFLRKRLALFQERHTKPMRPGPVTRVGLVLLAARLLAGARSSQWSNLHADPLASPGLPAHLAMASGLAGHSRGCSVSYAILAARFISMRSPAGHGP